MSRQARRGKARIGLEGHGTVWNGRHGEVRLGESRMGMARQDSKTKGGKNMVYKWNPSYHAKADAQVAGAVCEQLAAENRLTAQELVDVSEPKTAPLHDAFEWNNKIAGNEWRKEQARRMIRSLLIVREDREPVKMYFNLETKEPEYKSIKLILESEDDYRKMLSNALGELRAFQLKYAKLRELEPLFSMIETLGGENCAES